MGLDNFKAEVERRLGYKLEPSRPFTFDRNIDDFGWVQSANGKWSFTMFIENGRVADEPGKPFKSALEEIAKEHSGTFRLTANQHLILADVAPEDLDKMKDLLAKHKLDNTDFSGLRLSSSACVAFPTCGLAMAESERVSESALPHLHNSNLGSVFADTHRQSGEDVRREWITARLHCHANDRMSKWLRTALSCW